jgi:hypothetical protein
MADFEVAAIDVGFDSVKHTTGMARRNNDGTWECPARSFQSIVVESVGELMGPASDPARRVGAIEWNGTKYLVGENAVVPVTFLFPAVSLHLPCCSSGLGFSRRRIESRGRASDRAAQTVSQGPSSLKTLAHFLTAQRVPLSPHARPKAFDQSFTKVCHLPLKRQTVAPSVPLEVCRFQSPPTNEEKKSSRLSRKEPRVNIARLPTDRTNT